MKKPTTYKVPVSWVRQYPRHGFNHGFWIAVAKRVRARGIRKTDLGKVRAVCREVTIERRIK